MISNFASFMFIITSFMPEKKKKTKFYLIYIIKIATQEGLGEEKVYSSERQEKEPELPSSPSS